MKKFAVIATAALMVMYSFAGCGNDDKNTATTPSATMQSDSMDNAVTDGVVTDDDGIIGNEENSGADNADNGNSSASGSTDKDSTNNSNADATDNMGATDASDALI